MQAALQEHRAHPEKSYATLAAEFHVPKSTLHDRAKKTHAAPGVNTPRNLSLNQEEALVAKINDFAS
jgi:hypothetical protein